MRLPMVVMVLGAGAAWGQAPCSLANDYCVPVVGCIEETREFFRGQTNGADKGPLRVEGAGKLVCTGTWQRTFMGLGIAEFACEDGRSGKAIYSYFEPETGTAVGTGTLADGMTANFWSGHNLETFFEIYADDERALSNCAMPMS